MGAVGDCVFMGCVFFEPDCVGFEMKFMLFGIVLLHTTVLLYYGATHAVPL